MRKIKLTQGKFALVDDEDFEWLNQWSWNYGNNGYAVRSQRYGLRSEGKSHFIRMHRLINCTPKGLETDHRNGNKLDNRKSNLRSATRLQNLGNRVAIKSGSSRYKGVHWDCRKNRWIAQIGLNGKSRHLGTFKEEIRAARAYDQEAKIQFIEFACLNLEQAVKG